MHNKRKLIGTALVVAGTIIVGFSPRRWDIVILELPRDHGIHPHDLIGMAFVVIGLGLLWRSTT